MPLSTIRLDSIAILCKNNCVAFENQTEENRQIYDTVYASGCDNL